MEEPYEDDELIEDVELTPLEEVAIYCHEMYESLVSAGFSTRQALWLTAYMQDDADKPPPED